MLLLLPCSSRMSSTFSKLWSLRSDAGSSLWVFYLKLTVLVSHRFFASKSCRFNIKCVTVGSDYLLRRWLEKTPYSLVLYVLFVVRIRIIIYSITTTKFYACNQPPFIIIVIVVVDIYIYIYWWNLVYLDKASLYNEEVTAMDLLVVR